MKSTSAIILFGLLLVGSANAQEKDRPVSKIIVMLKDMIAQLEKEGEEDEDIMETMACWCETNDKLKTQAIADGKQRIDSLTAAIEEFTANSARLNTEISNLNKEVSKNQRALDQATALRNKNNAEFIAEEKDLLQSIGSMKAAIIALSKHNKGAALLQMDDGESIDLVSKVGHVFRKHSDLLGEAITPHQREVLKAFVQQGAGYAPQSGEIFGIMQAMKESFEINLATSQKTEASELDGFTNLSQAKTEEIKAGQDQIDAKTDELASTDEKNANSKTDLEETTETLAEDTKFLADLKDKCANADQEYEERTKTRQLEIGAVSKALEFLSSDEAHALFTKTFNPSMLQQRSQDLLVSNVRSKVVKVLQAAAAKSNDPRLSEIAVRSRMDAFSNLKKTIQTMVDRLLKEKEDEIKHKDFCVEQLNTNTRETEEKTQEKDDTTAKINDLQAAMDALMKDIESIKAQMADLSKQLKMAGEDREKANKDFQVTLADQRATQKLVGTALGVLKDFYEKAALVQAQAHSQSKQLTGQAPPPGFKSYEKNKSSGGVMGMMQGVIDDAKALESEAIRAEENSQKAYEDFVVDSNNTLEALKKELASKTQTHGKTDSEKLDSEVDLDHIMSSLDQLATENADIHRSCDFVLKNWEVRTAARDAEIESLKQAIALFSGAKMAALLQNLS